MLALNHLGSFPALLCLPVLVVPGQAVPRCQPNFDYVKSIAQCLIRGHVRLFFQIDDVCFINIRPFITFFRHVSLYCVYFINIS